MTSVSKRVGNYNVLGEIGSGGMAVVYRAEQPSLGRMVAIKELRTELAHILEKLGRAYAAQGDFKTAIAHMRRCVIRKM